MSGGLSRLADVLAVEQPSQDTYGTATYLRTDPDGTAWVRLAGSDIETPANGGTTVDAREGDTVTVRQDGTRLYIMGNGTAPSVGHRQVAQMLLPVEETVSGIVGSVGKALADSAAAQKVADAVAAIAEATAQHFWTDNSGVHVTQVTQEAWEDSEGEGYHSGPNVLINALGQLFRDGLNNLLTMTTEDGARALTIWDGLGNAASNVRAVIGEVITLGKANESHAEIDYNSLQFIDGSGNTFFLVNDAAEVSEATSLVEVFESTGLSSDRTLTLNYSPVRSPSIYRSDGRPSTITSISGNVLTLENALYPNSIAIVQYETSDYLATNGKTMVLGVNENVPLATGAYSASVGTENQPSGNKSMTVGSGCRTVDPNTLASGSDCLAGGEESVALGMSAKAVGIASFAQGGNVIAYGPYQHAIGRFNEIDTDGKYPLVIGNGTANGARSNALTVDWDGRLWLAGNVTATSIELKTNTPFIDFHFDNSTADYTSRIIENASGHLNLVAANGVSFNGGALPRASGGTGVTGISTSSATLSNCTASGNRVWHNGVTCSVTMLGVQLSSALANGASVAFGTLPSGYRPSQVINDLASSTNATFCGRLVLRVGTDGALSVTNRSGSSMPANTAFSLFVTYAI